MPLQKNWFFNMSYIMLVISMVSMFIMYNMSNLIIHFSMDSICLMPMSISLVFDIQSSIFISTVSIVTFFIYIYSFLYLKDSENIFSLKKFLIILSIFVISMFVLSLSGNLFWVMIGWDGLGISSFCLIFFYQNWKSFSSSMVTFLSNRFGDVFMIISVSILLISWCVQSWTLISLSWIVSLTIGMGAYSKSAQIPYSFWLPQAMAAPTPVSALVHSSTLVTAGVYIFCRFNSLINNMYIKGFFLLISFITMMIAGTSSLMEFDIKKVIAFSTLCHVSLMMMFSILGDIKTSLFHLMMHAFFKSLLFMIAGYLIHESINSQDVRLISEPLKNMFIGIPFFISIFSMMGFPFMSGFYSKELMLTNINYWTNSMSCTIMFMINSFFSCAYSMRLMKLSFLSSFGKSMFTFKINEYGILFITSACFSSFIGGIISAIMIEENIPTKDLKLILFTVSMVGMFLGLNIKYIHLLPNYMMSILLSMWKMNNFYKTFQKYFFMMSSFVMWSIDEKGASKKMFYMTNLSFMNTSHIFMKLILIKPLSLMKLFHLMWITSIFL